MGAVMEYLIDEYETLVGKDLPEEEREIFSGKFMKMYETRDLYQIYRRFLEYAGYDLGIPGQTGVAENRDIREEVPYAERFLAYEDVYPMLYMKYRLLSPGSRKNIKHLVIDEMQDYSGMQYMILAKIFPCKMTILGDKAQTMDEKQQDVSRFLPKILGKDIRKIEMNKSYRNTVEIARYAADLAGITELDLFERHGKPVAEAEFEDVAGALDDVAANLRLQENGGYETAAVLAMTEEEAREIYRILQKKLGSDKEIFYLDRDSSSFRKGLTVTTFYLAKGLEFDQVFTVYGKQREDAMIRQAKYICATRALHELFMYHVGEIRR